MSSQLKSALVHLLATLLVCATLLTLAIWDLRVLHEKTIREHAPPSTPEQSETPPAADGREAFLLEGWSRAVCCTF